MQDDRAGRPNRLHKAAEGAIDHLGPKIRQLAKAQASLLSGGEQQMLDTARGLFGEPKALMIDELSLGLSPKVGQAALEPAVEIARNRPGVLIVDSRIAAGTADCDRVYVLKEDTSHLLDQLADPSETLSEVFF